MIKNCIDKENILDLIYLYIQFIITYWGQNILSPPPHIFEWGVRYPPLSQYNTVYFIIYALFFL